MGLFKKKEQPIILQPQQSMEQKIQAAQQPIAMFPAQQTQAEVNKETKNLLEERRFEILEEKTAMLKERTDHLSTSIKLREETLSNILELLKTIKDKQDNMEKTIEKIETFLKSNAEGYDGVK